MIMYIDQIVLIICASLIELYFYSLFLSLSLLIGISRPADSNNLPGVPSKVSNSEDDQAGSHNDLIVMPNYNFSSWFNILLRCWSVIALSIQPPADYNLDEVSIIVSNSEVHQGSQEHLLSSGEIHVLLIERCLVSVCLSIGLWLKTDI